MNPRIQIIRALAIIAVVAIHTPAPEPYVVYIRPFLNFAVAMFLFLSAYLTENKTAPTLPTNYRALLRGRFKRLLPTYVVWVIIASLLLIIMRHAYSPSALVKTLFYQSCGAPYYFFLVYFQLMLLHPLSSRLEASRYKLLGIAITPLALAGTYAINLGGISLPGIGYGMLFPAWFAYYYLGIMLARQRKSVHHGLTPFLILWGFSLLPQMAEGWFWYTEGSLNLATTQLKVTSFLSSSAACLLAWAYIKQSSPLDSPKLGQRLLVFIGNCSMGIFLCHCCLIPVWQKATTLLHMSTPWPTNTLVVFLSSLLLIMLANRILPHSCCQLLGFAYSRPETGRR